MVLAIVLNGCTGVITGHKYTKEEVQDISEVIKDIYKDIEEVKKQIRVGQTRKTMLFGLGVNTIFKEK